MMNYLYTLVAFVTLLMASCTSYDAEMELYAVEIQVTAEEEFLREGFDVVVKNSLGKTFTAKTDRDGIARFSLPAGLYDCSTSRVSDDGYFRCVQNGSRNALVVGSTNGGGAKVGIITLTTTWMNMANPLLIKELYVGGCQKDDGSGAFTNDKCIIIYNNSSNAVSLDNIGIGMIEPYNAEANSHKFLNGGVLDYEAEDWIPAINGVWYFQPGQVIEGYSELVVAMTGAIDHTKTYSNSINYANQNYYCMYDIEAASSDGGKYTHTGYYPAPSELIPSSHYLKAVKYGKGNAWPISQTSPAVIMFRTEDVTVKDFAERIENIVYPSNDQGNLVSACLRVKRQWVMDAVEVYNADNLGNKKRLTPDLDNGYVTHTSKRGHALIRKVEKYIDGHAVYQDTNNSTDDFYEAENCSLK